MLRRWPNFAMKNACLPTPATKMSTTVIWNGIRENRGDLRNGIRHRCSIWVQYVEITSGESFLFLIWPSWIVFIYPCALVSHSPLALGRLTYTESANKINMLQCSLCKVIYGLFYIFLFYCDSYQITRGKVLVMSRDNTNSTSFATWLTSRGIFLRDHAYYNYHKF